MADPVTFQPVIPTIEIQRLSEQAEIAELGTIIRRAPEFFPQFSRDVLSRARTRKTKIYAPALNDREPDTIIAEIGNYLATSENGYRYITDYVPVKHGIFTGFPTEMFVPFVGEKAEGNHG